MPQVSSHFPLFIRPVKTYLRSTTGDARLNHLMKFHVHRDRSDAIDLVAEANQFVGKQENRKQLLGTFTPNDLPRKLLLTCVPLKSLLDRQLHS